MKTIGRHLIAEYYGCDGKLAGDPEVIRRNLRAAAELVGATVVGEAYHRFEPDGVTGVVLIAESHLSIHTWPSRGYVAVDIFTCGGLDPRPGCELLAQALAAERLRYQEIVRGLPDEIADDKELLPDDVLVATDLGEARPLR
ncbi:MAG: adenosylmethionine decarboxylase [Acidobacteriota bacterium]